MTRLHRTVYVKFSLPNILGALGEKDASYKNTRVVDFMITTAKLPSQEPLMFLTHPLLRRVNGMYDLARCQDIPLHN